MPRILGTKKKRPLPAVYIYIFMMLTTKWCPCVTDCILTQPTDTTNRQDQPIRPTDTRTHLANATANWHVPGRRKRHRRWERKKDVNENNPCLSNDNKMGNEKKGKTNIEIIRNIHKHELDSNYAIGWNGPKGRKHWRTGSSLWAASPYRRPQRALRRLQRASNESWRAGKA